MQRSLFSPWGIGFLCAVAIGWHLYALAANSPAVPGPGAVVLSLIENTPDIFREVQATLRRAAMAFFFMVIFLVPLGIVLGRIRWLGDLFEPIIQVFMTIPGLAIAPLIMLFFGTGDWAKIAVVFYASGPNVLVNTFGGVRAAHPMLERVGRSLRLSRAEIMAFIDLPAAFPMIVTGMRLAMSGSLLTSITTEMILSTDGIGTFVRRSQDSFDIASGLAGILVISLIGLLLNESLRKIEKSLLFWHFREQQG